VIKRCFDAGISKKIFRELKRVSSRTQRYSKSQHTI
jgi:hypothetical protein